MGVPVKSVGCSSASTGWVSEGCALRLEKESPADCAAPDPDPDALGPSS